MTRGIINKTAVRRKCKDKRIRITGDAITILEELSENLLEHAISNMKECERTTVMGRDIASNEVVPR